MIREGVDAGRVDTETRRLSAAVDHGKSFDVNLTIEHPRYAHVSDTFDIMVYIVRERSQKDGDQDRRLLDDLVDSKDVVQVNAEVEAPGFTVLRITPSDSGLFTSWDFVLAPKPGVDGRQILVYRIRMLNKKKADVSYVAASTAIEIGTSPFSVDSLAKLLGVLSATVGIYLQITKGKQTEP